MSIDIRVVPVEEFARVRESRCEPAEWLPLVADMCRINALSAVKLAGSGHLGSSFSAMDIVVSLYYGEMNVRTVGWDHPGRDVYFSSKGHDVPGLYAVLHSLGVIPDERLLKLRRLGGLDGHPDIGVPGIEANSGSLGMGISKGRGIAWAKRFRQVGGRVFVMTGDGELQEGQNYEALQSTVQQKITDLTVIVDHNKVQSDKLVGEILNLGDLAAKFRASGWYVARCDGHDHGTLQRLWRELDAVKDRPKAVIADTIKGRGVSFMEHPRALADGDGYYRWHAGAPPDDAFAAAHAELVGRVNAGLTAIGATRLALADARRDSTGEPFFARNALGEPVSSGSGSAPSTTREYVVEAYGAALLQVAARRPDVVVLDADLAADCRTRRFELDVPDRFIQNGIAEQDMVSMAGGLARHGLLPVVNSFASFLASRGNEQIYNNATERSRIVYVCHYGGLIPAGPGKSHQSLRDVALFANLPDFTIIQPGNAVETAQALDYCIDEAPGSSVLRLAIGPSPRQIDCAPDYRLARGRGWVPREGTDALLFAYGPVMLHEALLAAELLETEGVSLGVVNQPWLNAADLDWLAPLVRPHQALFVLEDHGVTGALGDYLLQTLVRHGLLERRVFEVFGVEGLPACGTPAEALAVHQLDGPSLARRVVMALERRAV
ncbi:MAG: transketolase C-terminal domain-containing protein [Vicinamibacterales bacterium]